MKDLNGLRKCGGVRGISQERARTQRWFALEGNGFFGRNLVFQIICRPLPNATRYAITAGFGAECKMKIAQFGPPRLH